MLNSIKRLATIAAVSTSCLGSCYYSLQSQELGEIIDAISSLAAFITPSSLQELTSRNSFLVSLRLISLCPATKVCSVFSSRKLPSNYGGQISSITIVCIVLSASEASLASRKVACAWHYDFNLITLGTWKQHCSPVYLLFTFL